MICSQCGKKNASEYRRMSDGKLTTVLLCPDCYNRLYGDQDETEFFSSLLENVGGGADKICPSCGTSLSDFRRTGLLGCAECYVAFRDELLPAIRQAQGKIRHEGKSPNAGSGKNYFLVRELVQQQDLLKAQLERAMRERKYNEADRLKQQLLEINRRLYHEEKP